MGAQNSLRVLWATMADFTAEERCHGCQCGHRKSRSLKIRKVVEPDYPEAAQRSGLRGTVIVEALIDKNGIPDSVRILRGDPPLATAAFEAVRQWRWEPPADSSSGAVPIAIAVNFEPE
jgi:TonB family protein